MSEERDSLRPGETRGGPETAAPEVERLVRLLTHPKVRAVLAEIAHEEGGGEEPPPSRWQRLGSYVAGASSALVVLLAFLVPSVQDQWDRFQSRRVIQRHVELARTFMAEGRYKLAEASFAKALELSENKRLDIEEERLEAKVQAVNANPDWGVENPEGLEETDFLYLLQLQRDPGRAAERAATLECFGTFLASAHRWREAEEKLREAARLNPRDHGPWVNIGNLLRDRRKPLEAEAAYRRALSLDSRDGRVHYDLGLVLDETGRPAEAQAAFEKAAACDPADKELLRALATQLEKNGKAQEARRVFEKILVLDPSDAEARRRIRPGG